MRVRILDFGFVPPARAGGGTWDKEDIKGHRANEKRRSRCPASRWNERKLVALALVRRKETAVDTRCISVVSVVAEGLSCCNLLEIWMAEFIAVVFAVWKGGH